MANSALASAILRVCHSIMGNLCMIVSDSAKYCNSHLNFGFIIYGIYLNIEWTVSKKPCTVKI